MSQALQSIKPVRKAASLGKQVRDELRTAIMAGRFRPGEKLTIRAVASALGVSLTPAREALYNLAAEGALELAANGSVYVPTLTVERVRELTKIRLALEGLAAREAAERIADRDIARAEKLNSALVAADGGKNYAEVFRLNWQFHFAIYGASAMPHLLRMIEGCWLMTGSYLNIIYPDFGRADDGVNNHREILEALKARDPDRLAGAVCRDIEFAASALMAMIADNTQD